MSSKTLRLLAILATCLVIVSGIHMLLRRPAPTQAGPPKKPTAVSNKNRPPGEGPCKIKHAAFGGTESTLLKFTTMRVAHYVVVDHPKDNPMMPYYARDWLEANYAGIEPMLIGEFPTVEEAMVRAASLCRSN